MDKDKDKVKKRVSVFNRIGTKLFMVTLLGIVVSVAAAVIAMNLGNAQMVNIVLEDSTQASMNAVLNEVSRMEGASLKVAEAMSADEGLIAAIETGDSDKIRTAAKAVLDHERADVEFVSIADAEGTVMARTHNDATGDSIAAHRNMAAALSGSSGSYIETGTKIRLSIISSAPVKNDSGQIIAGVAMGYQLDNPDFVDKLKTMTGSDITIFVNDERINTTIMRDGERQVGTKLSADVAEIVLDNQQKYISETSILGNEYMAVYNPIITNGEAVGILFSGKPIGDIRVQENTITLISIAISLIAAVIALIVIWIITNRMIVKPVAAINEAALNLAEGNLNVGNLLKSRDDEIGQLGISMKNVSGVINQLIEEMENMAVQHELGDSDVRIDVTAFHGAYGHVATGLNALVARYIKYLKDICVVLNEFGKGNFDVEYKELPGKNRSANESVEEIRGLLKDVEREIETLGEEAVNGRLSVRANADAFMGGWRKLLIGLNALMDAVIEPINEAAGVLKEMSDGNLKAKMHGDYKGDFNTIKQALNSTQDAISSYILEISETLSEMSKQNLDVGIARQYIGDFSIIRDDINMIIETFNKVLIEFGTSAEQVAYGAKQISDTSSKLSEGASGQSSAVEELTAIIAKIAEQTGENAEKAEKASELTADVSTYTKKESEMMNAMLKAMEDINESSANISKIIKVIEDIAFQTNLLALNAAVEAARAGEHGKGFAVVADEVRNLASRSQSAARDTTELIEGSVKKVAEGVAAANNASEGLGVIVGKISEVAGYIGTIAQASREQSESISQVNIGINEVSIVTQQNTAISEESAAAAEELSGQSELLKSTISNFKLLHKTP